jgi:hypothetical protein
MSITIWWNYSFWNQLYSSLYRDNPCCHGIFWIYCSNCFGSKNSSEGYTTGFFLSLVILVLGGFILGILLFVVVGILTSLTTALGSFSSLAPAHTTDSTGFLYDWLNLIEGIGIIILVFLFGGMGGGLGYYIKSL